MLHKNFTCWKQFKFFILSGNLLLRVSPLHIVNCLKLFNFTLFFVYSTRCDGFDARDCLHWLVHLLITCRVELHCFAWSFVSHVGIRSFLGDLLAREFFVHRLERILFDKSFVRGCCRWWKSWWNAFVRVESLLPCEFISSLIFLFSIFRLFFGVSCFLIRVEIFHYLPRTCSKYRRRVRFAPRDGRRWPRHVGAL